MDTDELVQTSMGLDPGSSPERELWGREPGTGFHRVRIPGDGCTAGTWKVSVHGSQHQVTRVVSRDGRRWVPGLAPDPAAGEGNSSGGAGPEKVIWPTWPATLIEERAMSTSRGDLQQTWDAGIGRLRDTARWSATVLGAALASIIPTASLSKRLAGQHLTAGREALGLAGLARAGIAIVLILRVLLPRQVSYDSVLKARAPDGLTLWLTPGPPTGASWSPALPLAAGRQRRRGPVTALRRQHASQARQTGPAPRPARAARPGSRARDLHSAARAAGT
jgi:hypothetical protein